MIYLLILLIAPPFEDMDTIMHPAAEFISTLSKEPYMLDSVEPTYEVIAGFYEHCFDNGTFHNIHKHCGSAAGDMTITLIAIKHLSKPTSMDLYEDAYLKLIDHLNDADSTIHTLEAFKDECELLASEGDEQMARDKLFIITHVFCSVVLQKKTPQMLRMIQETRMMDYNDDYLWLSQESEFAVKDMEEYPTYAYVETKSKVKHSYRM